jgi:protein-S-isoprenylcysteine O-methyltransferase
MSGEYEYDYEEDDNRDKAIICSIATCLGIIFTTSLYVAITNYTYYQLAVYMVFLTVFHFLEFIITAIYHPMSVSWQSFLLDNRQYILAHSTAILEYLVCSFLLVIDKSEFLVVSRVGLVMAICGQLLRSAAMVQAASNFNHLIQLHKDPNHVLVTNGVYSLSRHPSYTGFFYYALGLQLFMLNPVCTVVHVIILWRFFNDRIKVEESYLFSFFKKDYLDYKERTPTCIPFIK